MWDDALARRIAKELQEIDALLALSAELRATPEGAEPSFERLAALAQGLASFYTGVERILERLARRFGGGSPSGDRWHMELLVHVARATASRPAVIFGASRQALRDYLAFRHRSRHAYTHHLEWAAMGPLVVRLAETWDRAREQVETFVARPAGPGPSGSPSPALPCRWNPAPPYA